MNTTSLEPVDDAASPDADDAPTAPPVPPLAVPPSRGLARLFPRSLLGRQLLVLGLILGVGNGLLLQHFRDAAAHDIVDAEQRRMLSLARVAAAAVDGSAHEAAAVALPGRDAFVAWSEAPEGVHDQQARLGAVAQDAALASPTYTLRIREDARDRILAEPDRPHPDALEFVLTSADVPYWRHPLTYRPAMAAAFFDGVPSVSGQYADDHGEWVTAWAPVVDDSGTVVAVAGVDAPLESLLAPLGARQWRDGRILAATFALTFLAVVVMVRKLGHGLRLLQQAAERMGKGDYATPIQAFGFAEVVQLARGLEGTRRQVAQDMNRLERLRRTLGRSLAEAAEQVDAAGRRRRQRYARLAGDLRVGLEVGRQGRPLPARLIDLSYDGLVVGMRRELAPDLAHGMIGRVHLETRGQTGASTYAVVAASSTPIDDVVHLSFTIPGGVRIEDLPLPVAKVLNQRKALRVSPGPDTLLRVAVRRSDRVRPKPAEVLDLSSDGIKILLHVTLERFSTWGTTMEVALRFHPEDPALRMTGRVRNCRLTADGRVTVGLAFDGNGNPAFEQQQQAIQQWVMATDRAQREARERKVS